MIELIAEISTNHGGDLSLAKAFIDRFAGAGADWVKFQYTRVTHLRPDDPQYDWFKSAELSDEQFAELKAHTEARGAKFLLTVFNAQDVPAVRAITDAVKIGSGEAREYELHEAIEAARFARVFASMPWDLCNGDWTCLRCIARYPTPEAYARRVASETPYANNEGWSDHVIGLSACEDAMLAGASIIEKHVQLPTQARPCRPFEATVEEFKALRRFADDDPETKFKGRWQHA